MAKNFEYQWSQLVARAWTDPAFKAKLLADPAAVLKENGMTPPAGVQLKVLENTDKVVHLVVPAKPAPKELSEEDLHRVAGGGFCDAPCDRPCDFPCRQRCGEECGGCGRCGEGCARCGEGCERG